jgi:hypothetical protein
VKPVTPEAARLAFESSFGSPSSPTYIPAKVVGTTDEIVPETVFEFRVEHEHYLDCTARMYCGVGNALAGRLWQQEAQSLVRFSGKQHPALPQVVDAVFRDEDGVGVVLSKRIGDVMTAEDAARLRANPALAFRCLSLAADAVRALHSHGLIHRDVWRGSFAVVEPTENATASVCLFGFEMSAFVASLLDPVWRTAEPDGELLESYLARGGPERSLFRAPETLRHDSFGLAHLTYRSDIFSLGVCAFEWFIDELPQTTFHSTLGRSKEPAEALAILEERIVEARHVPEPLRDLLREMIRFDPRIRPTAAQVVNELVSLQDGIASTWTSGPADRPYLVAIAPEFVDQFVQIEAFRDLSADPDQRFDELRTLIERDLAGALLVHEPGGARGYVQGGDHKAQQESVWVLIGKLAVYFCQEYSRRRAFGAMTTVHWALHVKYVVDQRSDDLRSIAAKPLRQRIRAAKVVHSTRSSELDPNLGQRDHPSWQPLLKEVNAPNPLLDWTHSFIKGINWWISVQARTLDIRQYAYRRAQDHRSPPRVVRLVWDVERDQRWIERRALRNLLATLRRNRPAFGDFFETLPDRDLGEEVTWRGDDSNQPARGEGRNRGRVTRVDSNTIDVEVREGTLPPLVGWLRPTEDISSEILLNRETRSTAALFAKPQLMQALFAPRSFPGPRSAWNHAGEGLRGRAPEIVKDMLSFFPFYALQGPPGTGKTTVVAHAVKAYLRAKPGARILVSAQSHYALDELADRLMHLLNEERNAETMDAESPTVPTLGAKIIALRVAGEQSLQQVRESIRKLYMDGVLAAERVQAIKDGKTARRNGKHQAAKPTSPQVQAIRGQWQAIAESSLYEIQDHIWRGANIVFATSGTCTENLLGVHDEFDAFDWVIVEEAAKAWPVELAMPLVLGHRWTLIGDHHQLAAYGLLEVKDIYNACKTSPRPEVRDLVEDTEPFLATLELFAHLFKEDAEEEKSAIDKQRAGKRRPPIDRLDMQFRMNDAILKVVRRAFYPKGHLESADELKDGVVRHGIQKPAMLKHRALIWLDTSEVKECGYEKPRWSNPGEAEVVRLLVNCIRPSLQTLIKHSPAGLALLSPYQQQNQRLKSVLHADFTEFIHTTDSFQGQEADIVIVSLVRTNDHPQGDPVKRVGHVGWPQRANVLLSRARQLLVILGDFAHFRNTTGTVWPTVCATVEELQAREILPPDLGNLR